MKETEEEEGEEEAEEEGEDGEGDIGDIEDIDFLALGRGSKEPLFHVKPNYLGLRKGTNIAKLSMQLH